MNFEELNDTIPYVRGGKLKVLRYSPYPHVTIAMPGRHGPQTTPKHGDFVVMVDDPVLTYNGRDAQGEHQFNHDDIFKDVELSKGDDSLMPEYLQIIQGEDPVELGMNYARRRVGGTIAPSTFLCAVQCLAVAEHRRYAQFESQFGGRFLPFRFAAGIDEGLWTAEAAGAVQKKGRPGVEYLEQEYGVPKLTQELMS